MKYHKTAGFCFCVCSFLIKYKSFVYKMFLVFLHLLGQVVESTHNIHGTDFKLVKRELPNYLSILWF